MNISDRTYTNQQVLAIEKIILGELEWNLTVPTIYVFLVRFIKASMTGSDVSKHTYNNSCLVAFYFTLLESLV